MIKSSNLKEALKAGEKIKFNKKNKQINIKSKHTNSELPRKVKLRLNTNSDKFIENISENKKL